MSEPREFYMHYSGEWWTQERPSDKFIDNYFVVVKRIEYDELRTELARVKAKLQKLKALILLTDPVVSGEIVNDVALKQWNEFIRAFPDEGEKEGE